MKKTQHQYSVWYEFSPGAPPPLVSILPKSPDEIIYALTHFKGDVVHRLHDINAEAITSEVLPGNRLAVTIKTTANKDEIEEAVSESCKALNLRATRVGGVEVP